MLTEIKLKFGCMMHPEISAFQPFILLYLFSLRSNQHLLL